MEASPKIIEAFEAVVADMQVVCSQVENEKEAQRISDLRTEISRRDDEVTQREKLRSEALLIRDFCSHNGYTDVALALTYRIEEVEEEIARLRPVSQRSKLEQALRKQSMRKMVSRVLPRFEEIANECRSAS